MRRNMGVGRRRRKLSDRRGVVYIVDSCDRDRFLEAALELVRAGGALLKALGDKAGLYILRPTSYILRPTSYVLPRTSHTSASIRPMRSRLERALGQPPSSSARRTSSSAATRLLSCSCSAARAICVAG